MCFFFSLIPATVWLVVGYFVLFSSAKSSGGIQTFGRALAIWTIIIAVFFPIAGAYASLASLCPMEDMLKAMHGAQT